MNIWQKMLPFAAAIAALPVIAAVVLFALTWAIHLWNVPPWICGCIALLLTVVGVYVVWGASRAFIVARFRFQLRTFLIGISIVAIILGTVGQTLLKMLSQGHAVQAVVQSGGQPGRWSEEHNTFTFGYDPFDHVEVVHVRTDQAVAEILRKKEQFSDLQQLSFVGGATDACLKHASELNSFPRLDHAAFRRMRLTDKGLMHLSEWSNVRDLFFIGCAFTEEGLAYLTVLPNLEYLTLIGDKGGNVGITDAGMVHIGKLSTLKTLTLIDMPITDTGLAQLSKLNSLERLDVSRTSVTEDGMATLRNVLTDCWVTGMNDSFPSENQIHQIRVCEDGGTENEDFVIDNPDRIADVKACLERYVTPTVQWHREWESDSHGNIHIHFEGGKRRLWSCVVGKNFLRNGWGMHRRLSDEESLEIRDMLGFDNDNETKRAASQNAGGHIDFRGKSRLPNASE